MNRPERPKTKLVEVPSTNIIPERDIGMPPILETRHLGIDFGGLTAVSDFNFAVGRTEIAGLIGPNGAGKTTIFNLLTKVYQPTRGTILLDGMDTAGKTTIQVNQMGIARTFQNIRLFTDTAMNLSNACESILETPSEPISSLSAKMHTAVRFGLFASKMPASSA